MLCIPVDGIWKMMSYFSCSAICRITRLACSTTLRQLLVAALVQVFAEFPLLALKVPVQFAEIALFVAPLILGHGDGILLQIVLQALELVRHARQLLIAFREFGIDLSSAPSGRPRRRAEFVPCRRILFCSARGPSLEQQARKERSREPSVC